MDWGDWRRKKWSTLPLWYSVFGLATDWRRALTLIGSALALNWQSIDPWEKFKLVMDWGQIGTWLSWIGEKCPGLGTTSGTTHFSEGSGKKGCKVEFLTWRWAVRFRCARSQRIGSWYQWIGQFLLDWFKLEQIGWSVNNCQFIHIGHRLVIFTNPWPISIESDWLVGIGSKNSGVPYIRDSIIH